VYIQRIALGHPIPTVYRKPVAKCKIQSKVQQLLITKPYSLRIEILAYPTGPPAFQAPVRGVPVRILPPRLVRKN